LDEIADLRFKTYRFDFDQPENQKHRPGVVIILGDRNTRGFVGIVA